MNVLRAEVEDTPSTTILHLIGEIDITSVALLDEQLSRLIGTRKHIVVDFSQVHYLDMLAIHMLQDAHRRALEGGQRMALVGSDPIVHTLLTIVELHYRVPLYDTLSNALTSIGAGGGAVP